MRKIILFNMVTLDGFFSGPNGEIDWHHTDQEFNDFAIEQMNSADGLIFGRVTYEMMAGYWPTPEALRSDEQVATIMNNMPKIVVSRTLEKADWNNTQLVKQDVAGEILKIKQQPGKDLLLFGSAGLASTLTNHGLINEFRLMVNPVAIGSGKTLFQGLKQRLELRLLKSRPFANGNILLYYQPV